MSPLRRGFTLIEVLVAMAILILGMTGIMAMFTSGVDLHRRGVDQTSAAMLAETILGIAQAQALDGRSADEISTKSGTQYVFERSTLYPAYECRVTCTELNEREYRLTVDVRLLPQGERRVIAAGSTEETQSVRFESILLRR